MGLRQGFPARGPYAKTAIAVLIAALAVVAWLSSSTGASSASRPHLTLHGPQRGSTLRLSVSHGRLVLRGRMPHHHQRNCRFRHHFLRGSCRLAGMRYVKLKMGPRGDFVRVTHRIGRPLVVLLGPGSDKFIGNGERDICFPGGSRRNRCVGGPGNDRCVTGPRNSDCVGGAGNDFCRASTGSDGCWGGPGRDVCRMGPGQDGCHGEGGSDRLYGGADPDRLYGGPGWDYCNGGPGRGKSQGCNAGPRH
jgi:hypothetical protein